MRALITGGSGFLGRELIGRSTERGDSVVQLVRRDPVPGAVVEEVRWDPADAASVDPDALGHVDAVFNFSGVTVAKRWTKSYKRLIAESRIDTTRTLVKILGGLSTPPKAVVTASGLAIYGDRGEEPLTEDSPPGDGFLAGVAIPWEEATAAAAGLGCRALTARFGMVMSGSGGALPTLARPFRLGVGGRIGNGRQWTAWIHLDDAISALIFMAERDELSGPVNVAAPGIVRNAELGKAIGRVLGRPSLAWMPAVTARLAFGEYIQELAIASARATPERLLSAGFEFKYPDLESCLRQELG